MGFGRFAVIASLVISPVGPAEPVGGQNENDFASQVRALYAFVPGALGREERSAKSKELDRFWAMVKSDKARYMPLLRAALDEPGLPAFFYFDGGRLLLSASEGRDDKLLALRAFPRSNLSEYAAGTYIKEVVRLAHQGFDTSEAAFRVLQEPAFEAFIAEHSLTLGQEEALLVMLLPIDEALYVSKAIDRLSQVDSVEAQKSLLSLLWETVTDEGDRAIMAVATGEQYASEVREHAQLIMKLSGELEKLSELPEECRKEIKSFVPARASFAKVKAIRRKHVKVSDESLDELQHMNELLRILKGKGK